VIKASDTVTADAVRNAITVRASAGRQLFVFFMYWIVTL
jgi:hypothetical protein